MSVLPTELIGSYALPSWLWIVLERLESMGDLGETDLRETLTDAVRIAIDDQERAGLDVITDGEVGRRRLHPKLLCPPRRPRATARRKTLRRGRL